MSSISPRHQWSDDILPPSGQSIVKRIADRARRAALALGGLRGVEYFDLSLDLLV